MQRIPLTPVGQKLLEDELEDLTKYKRPAVIKDIDEARAHGDLKENAEYHAAKEQQAFIEGRIQEIQGKLAVAQVIDVTTLPASNRVIFGTTVTLNNLKDNTEHVYKIVGEDEANIEQGKLSVISPIARQLVGKETGEIVAVEVPVGKIEYKILKVEYL